MAILYSKAASSNPSSAAIQEMCWLRKDIRRADFNLVHLLNIDKMHNVSFQGESISFHCFSDRLLVFDVLYSQEMLEYIKEFQNDKISIFETEAKIFEWGDGMLLGEYFTNGKCEEITIEINQIKVISNNNDIFDKNIVFSTDTGVFCIIDYNKIIQFLTCFDYDDFVDTFNNSLDDITEYIATLRKNIGNCFAIISTPGYGKGFELEGGGSYYIERLLPPLGESLR